MKMKLTIYVTLAYGVASEQTPAEKEKWKKGKRREWNGRKINFQQKVI